MWNYRKIKRSLMGIVDSWVIAFLTAVLVATSFKSAIADWNDIPTGSMRPTILVGDRIFVNKLAYDLKIPYTTHRLAIWSHPERGDIVVFFSPEDGTRLVKRVVGIPGDTIWMKNNRLFINGKAAQYQMLSCRDAGEERMEECEGMVMLQEMGFERNHTIMLSPSRVSTRSFVPVTVPEGKYFMMGDNRDNSADSRFFGCVERDQIVGRANMVVISREDSFLNPRWRRFFKRFI